MTVQEALLSLRGRAILINLSSIIRYLEPSILLLVTSASDLPMRIELNSVLVSQSLACPSTDINDDDACCQQHTSTVAVCSQHYTACLRWLILQLYTALTDWPHSPVVSRSGVMLQVVSSIPWWYYNILSFFSCTSFSKSFFIVLLPLIQFNVNFCAYLYVLTI